MLLSLFIIIVLLYSIYIGVKRGLILQIILSIGFYLSFGFASAFYSVLSKYVELIVPYPTPQLVEESPFALYGLEHLFDLHTPFYNGLSFLMLFFIGWLLTRLAGRLLVFVSDIDIDEKISNIGGAVLSFFAHYIGLFLIMFLVSTLPFGFVQRQIESSFLTRAIVTKTPELSKEFYQRWVEDVDPDDTSNQ